MIPAIVVFCYLAIVLYVGIFAFRKGAKNKAEDFFVANRSLGTFVFLLSLFGSNMTSFAILGSSGLAFRGGIMVYGLMASISGIIIPVSIFLIGTRIWALGKKFGHMTQVQIFRDRWECGHIGTVIFVLQALMLVPYIIIGVMGGGETLEGISGGAVPYAVGGAVVALVVMSYVFFGGMRGTAWVNTLQTLMFLVFGGIAFYVIARGMGGVDKVVEGMAKTLDNRPTTGPAPIGVNLTRENTSWGYYASYALIPLSSIMFPHIAIFCLTAKKMASFKKTVILYPLCIMAIWLPAVFLGTVAASQPKVTTVMAAGANDVVLYISGKAGAEKPQLFKNLEASKVEGAKELAEKAGPGKPAMSSEQLAGELLGLYEKAKGTPLAGQLAGQIRVAANSNSDSAMLDMLSVFSPAMLAGVLGAAIMACVMASDSQILALSTMWAEDVYRFYGGKNEKKQIWSARGFVIFITIASYIIAIAVHQSASIFELAIQYAFSGFASMAPIMLACLFWKRSTKWGALSSTLWVATMLVITAVIQAYTQDAAPRLPTGAPVAIWKIGDFTVLMREYNRISFTDLRMLMVVPMFIGSALLMWGVSLATKAPSHATIEKYFPPRKAAATAAAS